MENPPETFIPISRFALKDCLTHSAFNQLGTEYNTYLLYFCAWRHQHYRNKLQDLKALYLPFSPDRDTLTILNYTTKERKGMQHKLTQELSTLLKQANYATINQHDLETIFAKASHYGLQLKVDLSEFDEVLLFSRGASIKQEERRTLKSMFLRKETLNIPIFQRLFLLLKLKPEADRIQEIMVEQSVNEKKAAKILKKYRKMLPEQMSSDVIYLKIFKQIPHIDLEMLFPNAQIKLKPFDKLKLTITAGGGTAGSVVAAITKLAVVANPLAIVGVLLGLAGVIVRQVTKFFTQRTKYMMILAQNLYFHNLANNRAVLTLMVDRAEEEEIKECFLLYHFLAHSKEPQPRATIKHDIEQFMQQQFAVTISFDIETPLQSLLNDGILTELPDNRLTVLPPIEALAKVNLLWKNAIV
ncbi:MAG TPA: DUF3754 domain-containing protein [Thiothrix sp.]|nr:DUF3754 domain-containing protein [Thiothrix sp.]